MANDVEYVPTPGECHPWYNEEHKKAIQDWLDERQWRVGFDVLYIPVFKPIHVAMESIDLSPMTLDIYTLKLYRKQYAGPAPWVGTPFIYEWHAAVDQHKRYVAGRAHQREIPGLDYYEFKALVAYYDQSKQPLVEV